MLKKRLIPKLQMRLHKSFRGIKPVLVVTRQFDNPRPIGDPLSQGKIYESQLIDELILVDLERTSHSWGVLLQTVESMAAALATPFAVGGGLNSFDQIQQLLDRGADKIVLNSAAIRNPNLISEVASAYGSQCVILSVDVKSNHRGKYVVWSEGGIHETGLDPFTWSREGVDRGAGEILLTSIDNDGMGRGLDVALTAQLSSIVRAPVIVSGGCGLSQHFVEGYRAGSSAVAAGSFFCHRDQNPMQCRSHIRNAGFPIRLEV